MNKKTKQSQPLMLHNLIVALSFWGTAVRTLLFAFIAISIYMVALSERDFLSFDSETMILIYVLGSFLLLDFGYVLVARSYPLIKMFDVVALFLAEFLLALIYVAPKLVVDSKVVFTLDPLIYVIFIPIIMLALRMLLALLYTGRQR